MIERATRHSLTLHVTVLVVLCLHEGRWTRQLAGQLWGSNAHNHEDPLSSLLTVPHRKLQSLVSLLTVRLV